MAISSATLSLSLHALENPLDALVSLVVQNLRLHFIELRSQFTDSGSLAHQQRHSALRGENLEQGSNASSDFVLGLTWH